MQVTCRNRAVGRSFACSLCEKSFPTKRHLNEHGKRKHPTIVVAQQQLTTLLVTPTPDCTTTATAVKCETNALLPMAPTISITDPQMSKPIYHTKPEYVYQADISLQDPSNQILSQNYSSMYDSQTNSCYMFSSSSVVAQQQQQQQHINNNCNSEEENVGSLLRLVYSCPDQILDHDASAYVVSGDQNNSMAQTHHYYSHQPHVVQLQNGCSANKTTSNLSTENIMDYPMLDGIPLEFM